MVTDGCPEAAFSLSLVNVFPRDAIPSEVLRTAKPPHLEASAAIDRQYETKPEQGFEPRKSRLQVECMHRPCSPGTHSDLIILP
jgi:hypothetical protein